MSLGPVREIKLYIVLLSVAAPTCTLKHPRDSNATHAAQAWLSTSNGSGSYMKPIQASSKTPALLYIQV